VYDITDQDSFVRVKNWVKELRKMLGSNVQLALAGNKIDLERQRAVPMDEAETYVFFLPVVCVASLLWVVCLFVCCCYCCCCCASCFDSFCQRYAASVGAQHFSTSAKLGKGVNELFLDLAQRMCGMCAVSLCLYQRYVCVCVCVVDLLLLCLHQTQKKIK